MCGKKSIRLGKIFRIYTFLFVFYIWVREGKLFFPPLLQFSHAQKASVSQPLLLLPELRLLVALVPLQGGFVLIKGPIERAKGTQATDVQHATAYLLATYLWSMSLDTNKVGKLPLSMILFLKKELCGKMEGGREKILSNSWSFCGEHFNAREASHTSIT